MKDQETCRSKARELEENAERRLRGGSCGGDAPSYKRDEAAEDLEKAANFYKLGKLHEESAKASVQAAEIYESLEKGYAAAAQYSKAAREYKLNDNSKLSEHYLKMAIDLWSTDGKFSMAAKAMKDLAEDAEKEGDNDGAARLFSQAAEFYETADQTSTASGCNVKAADCLALSKKYEEASALFEKLAANCTKRDLGKYKYNEYQTKAVLCKMASGDLVAAKKLATAFTVIDSQSTTLSSLLLDLISAADQCDKEEFDKLGSDRALSSQWYQDVLDDIAAKIGEGDDAVDFT